SSRFALIGLAPGRQSSGTRPALASRADPAEKTGRKKGEVIGDKAPSRPRLPHVSTLKRQFARSVDRPPVNAGGRGRVPTARCVVTHTAQSPWLSIRRLRSGKP